jgi:hypothetical protein
MTSLSVDYGNRSIKLRLVLEYSTPEAKKIKGAYHTMCYSRFSPIASKDRRKSCEPPRVIRITFAAYSKFLREHFTPTFFALGPC